jgi:transposase
LSEATFVHCENMDKNGFQVISLPVISSWVISSNRSIKLTAKLHELGSELLPHPPYSPDLAPSDFFLFADLKRMLAGKKFSTNEEVSAENEAFFEAMTGYDEIVLYKWYRKIV